MGLGIQANTAGEGYGQYCSTQYKRLLLAIEVVYSIIIFLSWSGSGKKPQCVLIKLRLVRITLCPMLDPAALCGERFNVQVVLAFKS